MWNAWNNPVSFSPVYAYKQSCFLSRVSNVFSPTASEMLTNILDSAFVVIFRISVFLLAGEWYVHEQYCIRWCVHEHLYYRLLASNMLMNNLALPFAGERNAHVQFCFRSRVSNVFSSAVSDMLATILASAFVGFCSRISLFPLLLVLAHEQFCVCFHRCLFSNNLVFTRRYLIC